MRIPSAVWVLPLSVAPLACGSDSTPAEAPAPETTASPDAGSEASEPDPSGDLDCEAEDVLCYEFGPIELEPSGEWQGFQALAVGNDEPRAIVRLQVDQIGATSHHFIIAPWSGAAPPPLEGPYDLFTDDGLAFVGDALGGIIAGSVYKYVDISTGSYIGVRIPENAYLVNNGHYLDLTGEGATGITRVKIQTVPADEVDFLAIEAQPGTNEISVPPGEERTVGATWEPPEDVAVLLMTSHMHSHGTRFQVWSVIDGERSRVYETTEYDAPPLEIFSGTPGEREPLILRKDRGDHLEFECTHQNHDLTETLTYGPFANTSEMCIMPVYYVPNPDALLEVIETAGGEGGFSWEYETYGGS